MRFEKAVAFEKVLGAQLGTIRQQRDAEEFLLFGEGDRVFEQLGAVAVAAKGVVHDKVFQEEHETALGSADREEEIDHANDGAVPAEDENAAAIRLFEDEAEALQLFLLIWAEVFFFAEKLAEKIGEFVQIFKNRGLNNDFAHGGSLIP